ncbi:hypothetical protein EGM_02791 [Macaca fascicularis]|uniref:Uroplakin 3A n=1 Tax=Macaca fascicularis TaxID=9541 RepID=G7PFX8_MACFA|nr:hypothetical protein EGM_02791 [Macaca fascicularis]
MPPLWALLALGCLRFGSAVNLQPQLASVTFATNNPTLTTVALEKPLCMFDSSEALSGTHQVYLYVLVDSAGSRNASVQDSAKTPLGSTFLQTEGGRTGPYKAVAFDLIPCSDLPSLDAIGDVSQASQILNAYLVRVGANRTCLWDPNFQGLCNPPLSAATEYRWRGKVAQWKAGAQREQKPYQSLAIRSPPLLNPHSSKHQWPGWVSGGCAFYLQSLLPCPCAPPRGVGDSERLPEVTHKDTGSSDGEMTHDSQITQEAVPKSLGDSESSYTSVNRGPPLDRTEPYSSKLQD